MATQLWLQRSADDVHWETPVFLQHQLPLLGLPQCCCTESTMQDYLLKKYIYYASYSVYRCSSATSQILLNCILDSKLSSTRNTYRQQIDTWLQLIIIFQESIRTPNCYRLYMYGEDLTCMLHRYISLNFCILISLNNFQFSFCSYLAMD